LNGISEGGGGYNKLTGITPGSQTMGAGDNYFDGFSGNDQDGMMLVVGVKIGKTLFLAANI